MIDTIFENLPGANPSELGADQVISFYQIQTPLGPMIAGANDNGLCLLEFTDRRMLRTNLIILQKKMKARMILNKHPLIEKTQVQLEEYFSGRRKNFSIPLFMVGSQFQEKVWNVLLEIPIGETRSYSNQAKILGNPKSVRAVAKANGENRIAILIPCHRVIGSNGQLMGYSGGVARKQFLLDLEKPPSATKKKQRG